MSNVLDWFDVVQQVLFEAVVQPFLFNVGLGSVIEEAYDWTMWLLIGLLQIGFLLIVFGTLQRWRPVEPVIDRGQVRLAHPPLGAFPYRTFFLDSASLG